jgi:hypothetical protein
MYGNHNLIDSGEPPAFLLNSKTDAVVLYSPDVPNMVNRMDSVGVYNEPWIQDLGFGAHDVDYNYDLRGENVLERMRDFLVKIFVPELQGDYNQNGVVDAADYSVWRKGLGTTYTYDDYNIWRAHFGETVGSGSLSSVTVPEPATALLLLVLGAIAGLRRGSRVAESSIN